MSYARCVIRGTTYLITRRTEGRRFLFRPDPVVKTLFEYCLGEAAERFGCAVHGYCLMSNHLHLVVTDTQGKLPEFMQRFCRHLALGISRLRGHQGSVFDRRSYSAVALETEEAIIDKLAYTYCNPASANLVDKAAQWPGALSRPEELMGQSRPIDRPGDINLFRGMQPQAVLRISAPSRSDASHLVDAVRGQIEQREAELASDLNRRVLGVRRVLSCACQDAPKNRSPQHGRDPRFAAITREGLRQAAKKLREFRRAYRDAWLQLSQGLRGVVFPYGTWRVCKLGLATANKGPG